MERELMWVDKYEPKSIDELLLPDEYEKAGFRKLLKSIVETVKGGGPQLHLFFYGPPGCGKTTTARVIAREILGEYVDTDFHEFNASSEARGIDTIRTEIPEVCAQVPMSGKLHIILLDEYDSSSQASQKALRATMNKYQSEVMFILTANYPEKIEAAISKSRVLAIPFLPLSSQKIYERLTYIATEEKARLSDEAIRHIAEECGGDVRRAITQLQTYAMLAESGTEFTTELLDILKGASAIDPYAIIDRCLEYAQSTQITKIEEELVSAIANNVNPRAVITGAIRRVVKEYDIGTASAYELTKLGAEAIGRLNSGTDPYIELLAVFALITKQLHNGKTKRRGVENILEDIADITEERVETKQASSTPSIPNVNDLLKSLKPIGN